MAQAGKIILIILASGTFMSHTILVENHLAEQTSSAKVLSEATGKDAPGNSDDTEAEIDLDLTESPAIPPQATPNNSGVVLGELTIVQKRIPVTETRIKLTKEYTKMHYGFEKAYMDSPKIVVVHWTAGGTATSNYNYFSKDTVSSSDSLHTKYGKVNVSAHFIVDRDGTIWQLFDETFIARHCIGMNYHAIGIENVGGVDGKEDLTDAQLAANILLIRHLKQKYPSISLVIGHYEYLNYESTEYFTELIDDYRTYKSDPGKTFMKRLRDEL